jgi:hypothetical protein
MGAPAGNANAAKSRLFYDALRKNLVQNCVLFRNKDKIFNCGSFILHFNLPDLNQEHH